MRFDILSIFPEMFTFLIDYGIVGRAVERGKIKINVVNIRDFSEGPHLMTDDRPFGGGDGMVMKPEPIFRALESIPKLEGERKVILLTPQGQLFNQSIAWSLCELQQIILVCGRYEGVDERVRSRYVDTEISIGDYILTGGELPAMIIVEVVSRLIPGILGGARSNLEESFEDYLLEYPQYTRPRVFKGDEVPSVLLSGDHEKVRLWRRTQSIKRTLERRPDLLEKANLSEMDKSILEELKQRKL
ncbi:MAG: tRNA (guanosine(37)-N1)-methyltransferase TrmD [Deltaproteobacteria bacterium]|nr:MAG: tRNA (guanosine(37)-N1)-methyltransferase TrmD [Deltaproteobacteria bacterium]